MDEAGGVFWSVDARGTDGSGRSGRAGEVWGGLFWCGMACERGGAFEMLGHASEWWPIRDLFGPRWLGNWESGELRWFASFCTCTAALLAAF